MMIFGTNYSPAGELFSGTSLVVAGRAKLVLFENYATPAQVWFDLPMGLKEHKTQMTAVKQNHFGSKSP
jgi:CDP-diacylglycerol pyrophosphatase